MSVNRVCKFRKIIDCKACQAVARNRCYLVHRTGRTALQDRSTSFFAPDPSWAHFFMLFGLNPEISEHGTCVIFSPILGALGIKSLHFLIGMCKRAICSICHSRIKKNIKKYALHHAPKILFWTQNRVKKTDIRNRWGSCLQHLIKNHFSFRIFWFQLTTGLHLLFISEFFSKNL